VEGRNWKQQHWEIPAMIRALSLPRGVRVLEVGCGRGCGLTVLGKLLEPVRLVGLDIEEEFLAVAERSLGEANVSAELLHGDVRDMPLPSDSFDLVIDFGTCYHIAFAARALDEIHRVLTPGGLFVHETRLSQLLSHPIRSLGRSMPLHVAPQLEPDRWRMLWAARTKRSSSAAARWGS
jgi:ubiquinone/menaquinone biosynthesis C-methylase UbiE